MGNDLQETLKWMERQLLEEDSPGKVATEDEILMERVDALIDAFAQEEPVVGNFSRKSKGARAEQAHIRQQFDESAAVLTKTKRQLRREAKLRKKAEQKANVNRSIKGLVFLAILECLGILAILGWWLQ